MTRKNTNRNPARWLLAILLVILLIAFFIPWVLWDKISISGADLPLGNFFRISENNFRLSNPFPQFNLAITALWLIPVLAFISLLLAIFNKKVAFIATITGILSLATAMLYILFSNVLSDLGVQYSLQIGIYITFLASGCIILAGSQGWLAKIVLLVLVPVITWVAFYVASGYLEDEKHPDTANTEAAYTVDALELIREFQTNDSLANVKYREKIITVNGNISEIETPNDSTANIKFIDTTGSYAIFSFTGEGSKQARDLKKGDPVSIKGSCSGGVLSEILGTESISFKRCTINK